MESVNKNDIDIGLGEKEVRFNMEMNDECSFLTQAYNSLCSHGAAKQRFINEKMQNIITIIDFYITNLILFYIYGIINKNFGAKTFRGITLFKYILQTSVNDAPCEHRELISCVIRSVFMPQAF